MLLRNIVFQQRKNIFNKKFRLETTATSTTAIRFKSTYAVAFDIDGVLYRGSNVMKDAAAAVNALKARNIPTIFLTNGGGQTEKQRAKLLSKRLGNVQISDKQMFLAHTPLKYLDDLKQKNVVVLGKGDTKAVLENYGYENVRTVNEFHIQHPYLFPEYWEVKELEDKENCTSSPSANNEDQNNNDKGKNEKSPPVDAIIGIMNPEVWDRELQICCDILRSDGNVGTLIKEQKIPIYMSCPDFEYVTEFNVPRFGAGVFSLVLRHVFKKLTGRKLELTNFGKPYRNTYDLAEQHLQEMAKEMGYKDGITKIYGIGDNPKADIKGANDASDLWSSVLVRTGVFVGKGNDEKNPADKVVDDVGDALTYIFSEHIHDDNET
jgi:HAD superfamily hydrolase (TIGR01456 family)